MLRSTDDAKRTKAQNPPEKGRKGFQTATCSWNVGNKLKEQLSADFGNNPGTYGNDLDGYIQDYVIKKSLQPMYFSLYSRLESMFEMGADFFITVSVEKYTSKTKDKAKQRSSKQDDCASIKIKIRVEFERKKYDAIFYLKAIGADNFEVQFSKIRSIGESTYVKPKDRCGLLSEVLSGVDAILFNIIKVKHEYKVNSAKKCDCNGVGASPLDEGVLDEMGIWSDRLGLPDDALAWQERGVPIGDRDGFFGNQGTPLPFNVQEQPDRDACTPEPTCIAVRTYDSPPRGLTLRFPSMPPHDFSNLFASDDAEKGLEVGTMLPKIKRKKPDDVDGSSDEQPVKKGRRLKNTGLSKARKGLSTKFAGSNNIETFVDGLDAFLLELENKDGSDRFDVHSASVTSVKSSATKKSAIFYEKFYLMRLSFSFKKNDDLSLSPVVEKPMKVTCDFGVSFLSDSLSFYVSSPGRAAAEEIKLNDDSSTQEELFSQLREIINSKINRRMPSFEFGSAGDRLHDIMKSLSSQLQNNLRSDKYSVQSTCGLQKQHRRDPKEGFYDKFSTMRINVTFTNNDELFSPDVVEPMNVTCEFGIDLSGDSLSFYVSRLGRGAAEETKLHDDFSTQEELFSQLRENIISKINKKHPEKMPSFEFGSAVTCMNPEDVSPPSNDIHESSFEQVASRVDNGLNHNGSLFQLSFSAEEGLGGFSDPENLSELEDFNPTGHSI